MRGMEFLVPILMNVLQKLTIAAKLQIVRIHQDHSNVLVLLVIAETATNVLQSEIVSPQQTVALKPRAINHLVVYATADTMALVSLAKI